MNTDRRVLSLEPIANDPEVGRWLAAMEDARRDTLRELDGVPEDLIDQRPPGEDNSIGALLYHVALIEADWLLDDIFELADPWPDELLPLADRDEKGRLIQASDQTLRQHVNRLAAVRAMLIEKMKPMSAIEFDRPRARPDYDVTPAWVMHHLLQHEAEHRAQIVAIRDRLRATT